MSYKDASGDGSETTMLTADEIGSESPSVQYNVENDVENKQNHKHQTGTDKQFE